MRSVLAITAFLPLLFCLSARAQVDATQADDGFVSLFDGRTLDGWDGDPRLWSVRDGAIHGETTAENPANGNSFIVWRGGAPGDFVLKLRFRIENGNSGIQYRSKEFDQWRMTGYQAEIRDEPGWVGYLYHEAGRGRLVYVGEQSVISETGEVTVTSHVSDVEALKAAEYFVRQEWNEYTIIAQGNYLRHYINGYPVMAVIDRDRVTDPNDPADRNGSAREGLIGLQLHAGDPMVVEFRDIRLKTLSANYGDARLLFDGETLEGWNPSSVDCADTFQVWDGIIHDSGQPAGYIRTVEDFTNYTLHLQLKHVEAGNSGVLVRAQAPDKVWPRSIESQGMTDNMGDIWNIDEFPMTVDPARTEGRRTAKLLDSNERPLGEWNDYEITLNGGNLEILVNNLLQNTAIDCAEWPGKICLQSEGSAKEFRNIVLVPILEEAGE